MDAAPCLSERAALSHACVRLVFGQRIFANHAGLSRSSLYHQKQDLRANYRSVCSQMQREKKLGAYTCVVRETGKPTVVGLYREGISKDVGPCGRPLDLRGGGAARDDRDVAYGYGMFTVEVGENTARRGWEVLSLPVAGAMTRAPGAVVDQRFAALT